MNASMLYALHAAGPEDRWCLASHQAAATEKRRFLVAVASVEGTRVDGTFENAESFLLYEESASNTSFVGRQPCLLSTGKADPMVRTRLIADCDLVLCAGISDACRDTLSTLGIVCEVAYAGAPVSDAMSALAQ